MKKLKPNSKNLQRNSVKLGQNIKRKLKEKSKSKEKSKKTFKTANSNSKS